VTLAAALGLSVSFGDHRAVDRVDLAVDRGEIVGLLGANGAGKTTLIRALLGLVRPAGGAVELFGAPPGLRGRRRVGYVPQNLGLYGDLTVAENWAFVEGVFGLGRATLPVSLAPWGDHRLAELPLGVQRQAAFAVALSHRPELLVLDEPTSGVGPLGAARLWRAIGAAAEDGAGVLVTTHNMEEAEQCDRLTILIEGSVAARGSVSQVVGASRVAEVRGADWRRAYRVLDDAGLVVQPRGAVLRVAAGADAVSGLLEHHGLSAAVSEVPATLEEAFVALVSERDGA
jgi:ABC-2 type transport system ATP-binding protein